LIGDVVKETFELDGRAALTVKTLFRRPGMLTYEFLAGRRRTKVRRRIVWLSDRRARSDRKHQQLQDHRGLADIKIACNEKTDRARGFAAVAAPAAIRRSGWYLPAA